jgi:hypothetical protein
MQIDCIKGMDVCKGVLGKVKINSVMQIDCSEAAEVCKVNKNRF